LIKSSVVKNEKSWYNEIATQKLKLKYASKKNFLSTDFIFAIMSLSSAHTPTLRHPFDLGQHVANEFINDFMKKKRIISTWKMITDPEFGKKFNESYP